MLNILGIGFAFSEGSQFKLGLGHLCYLRQLTIVKVMRQLLASGTQSSRCVI